MYLKEWDVVVEISGDSRADKTFFEEVNRVCNRVTYVSIEGIAEVMLLGAVSVANVSKAFAGIHDGDVFFEERIAFERLTIFQ